MTVLNGHGLVGKTVSVTATTAIVQLLVDATSTVGARLEGSNKLGLLNGTGDAHTMQLTMLDTMASGEGRRPAGEVGDARLPVRSGRAARGGRPRSAGRPAAPDRSPSCSRTST